MPDIDAEVKKQMEELVELNKQLLKKNEEQSATIVKMQKDIDDLLKSEDGMECKLEDGSAGTMKMGKCVAKVDKAAVPESVQKVLDAQAEEIKKNKDTIAKLQENEEVREWVGKAAAYSNLPIKADALGPILKSASKSMKAEEFNELDRVLKAGDAVCKELLKIKGSGAVDAANTAYGKLEGIAKEIQKSEKVSFEKAFSMACDRNKELYAEQRAEKLGAH